MSWYELPHESMVSKGHTVATMEGTERLIVVRHSDEIDEREDIA